MIPIKSILQDKYKNWVSSTWAIPLILFGVSFMAFGLLAPKLGFYMDDWPYIYYAYTRGVENISEMLLYDSRPYAGWLYTLGFKFFGFKPLYWHLSTLFFRWLSAFSFWLILNSLWKNKKLALYAALLFVVYPFFLMQPLALGSTHHWVGFSLYLFSVFLMIQAELSKKGRFFLIVSALVLEGVHLFTAEYFSGLELVRPVILWILLSRQEENIFRRTKKVFFRWLPYLAVLVFYFYWRILLFEGPPTGDRNTPVLLYQFAKEPLATIFSLFITSLKDSVIILFGSWYKALDPSVFELSSIFTSFALLILIFSFFILYYLLNHRFLAENDPPDNTTRKEAFLLGITALFFGTIPIWVIGKSIASHVNKMAATRFGIPSMLGASLLLALLILYFVTDSKKANMVLALSLALAIGVHLHNSHQYEKSWKKQKNLYYQLAERIPALDENTAIISAEEILFFMGEYPTAYAINTIYSDGTPKEKIPYWFSSIYASYYDHFDRFLAGMPLEEKHLLSEFHGNSKEILFISFVPELQQCLWVLRPEDANLHLISQVERQASLNSALDRIQVEGEKKPLLSPEIFGENILQNWCSYYQKADLARQRGDWDKIISLWETAEQAKKNPANGFEYIPFIEGYAHQGNWTQVKKMTRQANKVSQGMSPILCSTLAKLEETTPISEERTNILADLKIYLHCD